MIFVGAGTLGRWLTFIRLGKGRWVVGEQVHILARIGHVDSGGIELVHDAFCEFGLQYADVFPLGKRPVDQFDVAVGQLPDKDAGGWLGKHPLVLSQNRLARSSLAFSRSLS